MLSKICYEEHLFREGKYLAQSNASNPGEFPGINMGLLTFGLGSFHNPVDRYTLVLGRLIKMGLSVGKLCLEPEHLTQNKNSETWQSSDTMDFSE